MVARTINWAHLPVGGGSHRGGEGTRRPTHRDFEKGRARTPLRAGEAAKELAALPIVTLKKGGRGFRSAPERRRRDSPPYPS